MASSNDRPRQVEEELGEEDTLTPEELEKRNSGRAERVKTVIPVDIEEADIDVYTGGGADVEQLLDQYHDEVKELLTRLIFLVGLVAICLLLWRIGLLNRILGIIP